MSKTYIFAQITVKDFQEYAQRYGFNLLEIIPRFNGKILAAGPDFEMLEGEAIGNWSVLAEFDTYENAKRFYHSEEYAPLLALRTTQLTTSNFLTLLKSKQ